MVEEEQRADESAGERGRDSSLRARENAEWCLAPKDKADLFAATFTQKCILREKEGPEPERRRAHCEEQGWNPTTITVEDIGKDFQKLREESATGPDLLSSRVLKFCAEALAAPVHKIFLRIVEEGEWPAAWLVHWLVPIYKKKAACIPGNYRGVHLTAQLSKVIERLVFSCMQPFIVDNVHAGPNQFAYTCGRSARDAIELLAAAWIPASNG